MSELYVISLATDYTNAVENFEKSCKTNNINYKIIGLNEKFEGWRWRMQKYLDSIKSYKDEDIVIFSDSYDVIVQQNKNEIIKKFKKMDGNVIISSEMNLLLVPELKQFNIYPQYLSFNNFLKNNKSDYLYPCLGLVIGYKKYLEEVYTEILNFNDNEINKECYDDDQCLFSYYFLKNGDKLFKLDYKQELFGNMSGSLNRYEMLNGKLFNYKTDSVPSFIHFEGNSLSYYNYYMTPLGYKEVDIKQNILPFNSKLAKQIFDNYQEFWLQNVFQIYNNFTNNDTKFYKYLLLISFVLLAILLFKINKKINL